MCDILPLFVVLCLKTRSSYKLYLTILHQQKYVLSSDDFKRLSSRTVPVCIPSRLNINNILYLLYSLFINVLCYVILHRLQGHGR